MSSHAVHWAQQQKAGIAKFVLVTLADFADDQGRCRVAVETLVEITEQSEKTVRRQIHHLEDLGLIEYFSGEKGKNGTALVARTQLLMKRHAVRPAAPAEATEPPKNPPVKMTSGRPDKMTGGPAVKMTGGAPVKSTGQNDRHKEKDIYSLYPYNLINNNNDPDTCARIQADFQVVVDADLKSSWTEWVDSLNVGPGPLRAQLGVWATWIREGHADRLRTEAREVALLGTYAHPFAGLKARMKLGEHSASNRSAPGGPGAPGQSEDARTAGACRPGERRRDPATGKIWTVEELSWGEVTFEETTAPQGRKDADVATWELLREDGDAA